MYKVVRMERLIDSVFRDEFKFASRDEAEAFFTKECGKQEVVDIRLFFCFGYDDDKELTRFVRHKEGIKRED